MLQLLQNVLLLWIHNHDNHADKRLSYKHDRTFFDDTQVRIYLCRVSGQYQWHTAARLMCDCAVGCEQDIYLCLRFE